jgi:hypothetical protein
LAGAPLLLRQLPPLLPPLPLRLLQLLVQQPLLPASAPSLHPQLLCRVVVVVLLLLLLLLWWWHWRQGLVLAAAAGAARQLG